MTKLCIICLVVVLIISSFPVWVGCSSGEIVITREPGTSLQDLIDQTEINDTLIVKKGTYRGSIYINKSITIIGEDKENTIIILDESDSSYNSVKIIGDYVRISNITIYNSLYGDAIFVYGNHANISHNNIYRNNEFSVGVHAIYLAAGDNTRIEDNIIETTDFKTYSIYITPLSHNNYIHNNSMINGSIFIEAEELEDYSSQIIEATNTINGKIIEVYRDVDNKIINDGDNPIIFFNCSNIKVDGSYFTGYSYSILAISSQNIVIQNCTINKCIYGALFIDCENVTVKQNNFNNLILTSVYFMSSKNVMISSNDYLRDPPFRSPYRGLGAVSLWNCSLCIINNNHFRDLKNFSSIRISLSSRIEVIENLIENITLGITILGSEHITISKNSIKGINWSMMRAVRSGIFLYEVYDILIENNYLTNISAGITFDSWGQDIYISDKYSPDTEAYSRNLTILNNIFFNVLPSIDLFQVTECVIIENDFITSGSIEFDESHGNKIERNTFRNTGIVFDKSNKNIISNNSFHFGYIVFMQSSHNNEISNNIFNQWRNNSYAIRFMLGCPECKNIIFMNAFLGMNRYDNVSVYSAGTNYWHHNGKGNFWWNWTSPDHNLDGIVDIPYRIPSRTETYDEYPLTHYIFPDSDDDGVPDVFEDYEGTNPLDSADVPLDFDSDGIPDSLDMDRDGDGYENEEDLYPDDPDRWEEEGISIWIFIIVSVILIITIIAIMIILFRKFNVKKNIELEETDSKGRRASRSRQLSKNKKMR